MPEHTVTVVGVIAHLRRRQYEGDRRRETAARSLCDGGAAHPAERTRSRHASGRLGVGLRLHERGHDDAVVVRGGTRELAVLIAQRQTQTTEVRDPLGAQSRRQPMLARTENAEHDDPQKYVVRGSLQPPV
jgi:hypothetical protein